MFSNISNIYGDIHKAAEDGNQAVVKNLIKQKIAENPNYVRKAGRFNMTLLHYAAWLGLDDVCDQLLKLGHSVTCYNADNMTPLHEAAKWDRRRVAAVLLDHGANTEACTKNGETPGDLCDKRGRPEIKQLIIRAQNPEIDFFSLAVKQVHLSKTKELLAHSKKGSKNLFISYAWETDQSKNEKLQTEIKRLTEDLMQTGAKIYFDLQNMRGDINADMQHNIERSDHVLFILTPRFKARVEEPDMNNLKKEVDWALKVAFGKKDFIIPLRLNGTFEDSTPDILKNYLSIDFTVKRQYIHSLAGTSPLGLIPTIYYQDADVVFSVAYPLVYEILSLRLVSPTVAL